MKLKKISKNDLNTIKNLQPLGWSDIIPAFQFYINNSFCFPVKIYDSKKVYAVGSAIIHDNTAWIAHVIVNPEERRKGMGTRIVQHILEHVKSQDCKTISLLATEEGSYLYKKFGFKKQIEYALFKREKPMSKKIFSENILPYKESMNEHILQLDKFISGEKRTHILENLLHTSIIFQKENEIQGIYFPDLNEGYIIAIHSEAGIALMEYKHTHNVIGGVPIINDTAISFYENINFIALRNPIRMIYGEPFEWQPENIYSRIGGNLG